jgi:hypothetical protein
MHHKLLRTCKSLCLRCIHWRAGALSSVRQLCLCICSLLDFLSFFFVRRGRAVPSRHSRTIHGVPAESGAPCTNVDSAHSKRSKSTNFIITDAVLSILYQYWHCSWKSYTTTFDCIPITTSCFIFAVPVPVSDLETCYSCSRK